MDNSPAWLILGAVVVAFIALGLVWAFIADRRRNQEVAHDPERFDHPAEPADHTGHTSHTPADPAEPTEPTEHGRLHVDPRYRGGSTDT
ncbi:hypothetical protein FHP29_09295 [Nocardioides albidus]|uniref:Uncharacterized protein n=1 Tax=Nocardioides albidus TaxID=1517589 RepID=A0A5C4W0W5_9ACTN|nr:hypothetical protein [Nocardioides albidus]TNM41186.1 hypothetical protein FHP29_09295 [Nocardioides albidus]